MVWFAHGSIHPDIAVYDITINQVNQINRDNYYNSYFPKPEVSIEQLVISNKKGICRYRGYFKNDISQEVFFSLEVFFSDLRP